MAVIIDVKEAKAADKIDNAGNKTALQVKPGQESPQDENSLEGHHVILSCLVSQIKCFIIKCR